MLENTYVVTQYTLDYGADQGDYQHLDFLHQLMAKQMYRSEKGIAAKKIGLVGDGMFIIIGVGYTYVGIMGGTGMEIRLPVNLGIKYLREEGDWIIYAMMGTFRYGGELYNHTLKGKLLQQQAVASDAEVEKAELAYHDYVEGRPGDDAEVEIEDEAELPWDDDPDKPVQCTICGFYHGQAEACDDNSAYNSFIEYYCTAKWSLILHMFTCKIRWDIVNKLVPYSIKGNNSKRWALINLLFGTNKAGN